VSNRAVVFLVFCTLMAAGLGLFLWLTGAAGLGFLARLRSGWDSTLMAVRHSTFNQRSLALCAVLVVTAMICVARSIRKA